MEREKFDLDTIIESRRKSIEETITVIAPDAVKALADKLFPFSDHPWRQVFLDFVDENAGSTFYHATTHDPAEIIYCDDKGKGIWFLETGGKGPMQPRGLALMKAIVARMPPHA